MIKMEIWRDINGWEGIYQISSLGRLRSFKSLETGRVLSNINKKGGYFSVVLSAKGKKPRYCRMHRLVAEAFIPNPGDKPMINHKDNDKQNNRVSNLEWVTAAENVKHAVKTDPSFLIGMNMYNTSVKTSEVGQYSMDGNLIRSFRNCEEASRETNICSRNIHQVATHTEYKPGMIRKQAGGYRWEFIRELDIV